VLVNYIKAYQSNNVLTGRELWLSYYAQTCAYRKNKIYLRKIAKARNKEEKWKKYLKLLMKILKTPLNL